MDGNGGAGAPRKVTLIPGDGIGPEIIEATRRIIDAAGARIEWEERDAGESVFLRGLPSGVPRRDHRLDRRTRVALKGPLATPIGYGEKSANVTLRKLFETYANMRPVRELPGVPTPYSGRGIDLSSCARTSRISTPASSTCRRPGVAQCLKLISRKGCEKIARLAFEVARAEGRRAWHCATKANIMKLTEGLLKRTFEEVAPRTTRTSSLAHHHRQLRPPARQEARAVRGDRHHQHERRHHQRPDLGAGRRARVRALGEHRQRRRDLRGGARLGAQVSRART